MFKIQIETANDAFVDDPRSEIVRIFGRDEYVVKHATRQAAMRAAEAIYNDAKAG